MRTTYRVVVENAPTHLPASGTFCTQNLATAARTFADHVRQPDLRGTPSAVVLTAAGVPLYRHEYDKGPGHPNWWFDRLTELLKRAQHDEEGGVPRQASRARARKESERRSAR